MKITENQVVTLEYTLYVEEEMLESTRGGQPIRFLMGAGQVIPGLEEALVGLEPGDEKTVTLAPEDAYGIYDPDSVQVAKQEEFSEEIPLDEGTYLDFRDDEGDVLSAQIIEVDEETVTLDFNHPLAGKELTFEIKVLEIREATGEEIDHGHVH